MNKLEEARKTIEEVDLSIAKLFEKRMDASAVIAEYKKENGLLIEDKARERELLKKNLSRVSEKYREYYKDFSENVINISKKYQRNLNKSFFENSYIVFEKGALNKVNTLFDLDRNVLILTDSGVPEEYFQKVKDSAKNGIVIILPQGEQNKNFETYISIIKTLIENNFTRNDCIVSVGGGVIGDLAGFVASTYMRGIDFYNIPTTLLAQVDSSVGGKTAIDFCECKNIIGTFYQPEKVLIDTQLLKTLNKRQFSCGMAEIIKVFATSDKEMFEYLENTKEINIDKVVERAVLIKKRIVEKDEKEQGLRRVLNFGHTVGHGIECAENGRLLHGECIGIGMLCMASESAGSRIKNLLNKYDLPTDWCGEKEKLIKFITHDKKSCGDAINTVWVEKIGEYIEEKMTADEIVKKSREVLKSV